MPDPLRLAIVGCGGMGRRHLAGLAELSGTEHRNVELVAVCDPNRANAEYLAGEAERTLGARPAVFGDAEVMVRDVDGLEAADCVTDVSSHHRVATRLLELGLHTMCEKPVALTVRAARRVLDAAARTGRVLSIAENFRRDPMNRLVRALIDDGAIGEPQFVQETSIGGRDDILITPWRHFKRSGSITLDTGVHPADVLQYYFGPVESVSGRVRLFETTRRKRDASGPGGFYQRWAAEFPDEITPDGEDAMFGLLRFANGAVGQWTDHHAGHGMRVRTRHVFGTRGSIAAPGDRNGRPARLTLDDGTDVSGAGVLEHAPSYRLDPVAATLFGDARPPSYDLDFAVVDRKLIALEYHELARCVREGLRPEVDGEAGLRALALVYALFESDRLGRPVTVREVENGAADAYQRELDEHLGLLPATR